MTLEEAKEGLKKALMHYIGFDEEGALRMIEIIKDYALHSSVTKVINDEN